MNLPEYAPPPSGVLFLSGHSSHLFSVKSEYCRHLQPSGFVQILLKSASGPEIMEWSAASHSGHVSSSSTAVRRQTKLGSVGTWRTPQFPQKASVLPTCLPHAWQNMLRTPRLPCTSAACLPLLAQSQPCARHRSYREGST